MGDNTVVQTHTEDDKETRTGWSIIHVTSNTALVDDSMIMRVFL